MIEEEKIKNMIFLEQTTYYIYRSEEDRKNDISFLCTSNKETFERYKEAALKNEWEVKERK